jgi:poly(3-hydroxybutyrate) depolymerase
MKNILLAFSFIFSFSASAQEVYHFTKGFVANTQSRYGREALYTDPLAYQLYSNTLKTPTEGAVLTTNEKGEQIKWQTIEADSAHRFINRSAGRGMWMFRGGNYLYLTYTSDKAKPALLNVQGASGLYFNGEPHTSDPYAAGWLYIPVQLKKGLNELYIRGGFVRANLGFPAKPVFLNVSDSTVPHIRINGENDSLTGAVVIINSSTKTLKDLRIRSSIEGKEMVVDVPSVPAMATRKVPFSFDGSAVTAKGKYQCKLTLISNGRVTDEKNLTIEATDPQETYSETFISDIDGSLQYYAVTPQVNYQQNSALFLSVHGAGVEAIGQARVYRPRDWGTLVAATNRRPRGFNWEDWGRLDALEVLNIAKQKFTPDPQRIFLTGHSMGGHGTWFLGATYPDKWAAIAPCAGYPTLKGYGSADGLIPDSAASAVEQMLLRSSNQSDVIKLASNYKPLGVYIFHGDSDKVVSVDYARQMRQILGGFHKDMSYYEYPGGEHWFGDISMDWKPLFDFFQWHKRLPDSSANILDFITSSPGISSDYRWASVIQQHFPLQYSRIQLKRNKTSGTITGAVENVRVLKLGLSEFGSNAAVNILLDSLNSLSYTTKSAQDSIYLLKENNKWTISSKPPVEQKGPHRYGTFKDAFNHKMVFVYSTTGNKEENEWSQLKARYDAETWYYRGNGAVDIIPDKEFNIEKYRDRGVIIYGNKNTNTAWRTLLSDCPIQVERNKITAGNNTWSGDDLAAYFVWPIKGSSVASVGAVTGTGAKGMKAANANQYFAGASGFPDFMIYGLDMLVKGSQGVKLAGFYDHEWKLNDAYMVESK